MLRKNANNRKSNLLSRFRQRQQRRGKRTMGTETLEGRQLLATSPILLGLAPNVTYNENTVNTAPQVIDSNVFLIDDGPNFNGGSVTVSYSAGGSAQDNLTVINTDNGTGTTTDDITVSGSNISYGGVQIGTMSGGSSGSSLNVSLNASATPTAVDRLLESLAYGNSSDSPAGSRTIRVDVNDGADPAAAPRFTIINVTAENEKDFGDAPASYGTAEHTNSATGIPQSRLNGAFDAESVANSSANAQGDDTYGADDEADAVNANRFAPGFAVDLNIGANVHSTVGSIISAWVDYNIDGDFNDAGERVITNAVVANGNNAFTINVPQTATPGTTFMRVRITDNDGDNLNSATATR
ncbi:MAG: hypothetical protein KDA99_30650, partial [Planctomycetales bacterium]|nr:hypothetical protein [Planctomycetales bacterium]